MAKYTPENIARIVANGELSNYTQMEADLIGKLDGSDLVDDAAEGRMTLAYMYGTYAAWLEQDGTYTATVDTSYGPLGKSWTGFATENAARQYARAALRNHLTRLAADVLRHAREDHENLLAAS